MFVKVCSINGVSDLCHVTLVAEPYQAGLLVRINDLMSKVGFEPLTC